MLNLQAILGVSPVSNSALNPFIFLLFNSKISFVQTLTRSCCPLTRQLQNRLFHCLKTIYLVFHILHFRSNIFNKLFRTAQYSSSSSEVQDQPPDQAGAKLEPVKCLLDLTSEDNPRLCDCRGPDSHNHGCSHCDICKCEQVQGEGGSVCYVRH